MTIDCLLSSYYRGNIQAPSTWHLIPPPHLHFPISWFFTIYWIIPKSTQTYYTFFPLQNETLFWPQNHLEMLPYSSTPLYRDDLLKLISACCLKLLSHCLFFFFLLPLKACRILVPWTGIKLMPLAMEVQSWPLDHQGSPSHRFWIRCNHIFTPIH